MPKKTPLHCLKGTESVFPREQQKQNEVDNVSNTFSVQQQAFQTPSIPYGSAVTPQRRFFILVIDDSQTVRKIVETCLGREGFEVKSFVDGVEAIHWFTTPQARIPDLVILDIGLPKMDGYDIARRLKAKSQFSNTVIMMLSRRDGLIDHLKGRLAGAQAYMTKPFQTQELVDMVQSLLKIAPDG